MEVHRTDQTGQSDNFLLQSDFTRLEPDLNQTSSRIWSSLTDSIGSLMDCLAKSVGIGWVQSKSVGICRKRGGSVKYTPEGFHLLKILQSYLEPNLYFSLMVQTDKTIDATITELLKFGELVNVSVN